MDEIMRTRLAPVGPLSDEALADLLPVAAEWRDRAARVLAFAQAEIDANVVPITAFMRSDIRRL